MHARMSGPISSSSKPGQRAFNASLICQSQSRLLEDLADRIRQQPRAQLPARVTPCAVVIVNRALWHRCGLRAERARGNFRVDVGECRAADRTRRIRRPLVLVQGGVHSLNRTPYLVGIARLLPSTGSNPLRDKNRRPLTEVHSR
jgi:hypothetical protein